MLVGPQLAGQTVNKAEVEGERLDLLGREATENQPASQGAAPIRLAKLAEVAQVGDGGGGVVGVGRPRAEEQQDAPGVVHLRAAAERALDHRDVGPGENRRRP